MYYNDPDFAPSAFPKMNPNRATKKKKKVKRCVNVI